MAVSLNQRQGSSIGRFAAVGLPDGGDKIKYYDRHNESCRDSTNRQAMPDGSRCFRASRRHSGGHASCLLNLGDLPCGIKSVTCHGDQR